MLVAYLYRTLPIHSYTRFKSNVQDPRRAPDRCGCSHYEDGQPLPLQLTFGGFYNNFFIISRPKRPLRNIMYSQYRLRNGRKIIWHACARSRKLVFYIPTCVLHRVCMNDRADVQQEIIVLRNDNKLSKTTLFARGVSADGNRRPV